MQEWRYQFTSCFRYSTASNGESKYNWRYHDADRWTIKMPRWDRAKLSEMANKALIHYPELKQRISALLSNNSNTAERTLPDLRLIPWLASSTKRSGETNGPPSVNEGLALMLNHIVSVGTIEPFQILSTFVDGHVTVDVQKKAPSPSSWFYFNLGSSFAWIEEHILMQPEWFFNISDNNASESSILNNWEIVSDDKLIETMDRLSSIRSLGSHSVISYQHSNDEEHYVEIRLSSEHILVPYPKGRICKTIPIPGKRSRFGKDAKEPHSVLTPEIVIASPPVQECLKHISKIWQDRFAKSVLISAPPGSGKEAYAASIPYGNGRVSKDLLSISLAEDVGSLHKQLFGVCREDGSIQEGLIARASRTAIFFDEVHQPQDGLGIRPALLRPLEADEFYPSGSTEPQKVDDVLFILATSLPLSTLSEQVKPVDFWTRMTHTLSIAHPLDFDEAGNTSINYVTKCFFKCFWWDRIEKLFGMNPSLIRKEVEHAGPWLKEQHLTQLIDDEKLEEASSLFASEFSKILAERKIPASDVSIRGIRSMVTRMVSIASGEISRGKESWMPPFNTQVKGVIEEILDISTVSALGASIKPSSEYIVTVEAVSAKTKTRKMKTKT